MRSTRSPMPTALLVTLAALCLLSLSTPATAQTPDSVLSGVDLWFTPDDGNTTIDFSVDPIPGDFFCAEAPAFVDEVHLMGQPLSMSFAEFEVDTIVLRPKDASFLCGDTVTVPVQVAAVSLVSPYPVIVPGCGEYEVTVALSGPQPTTAMTITRLDDTGGTFLAPLEINATVSFSPLSTGGTAVAVERNISLLASSLAHWSFDGYPEVPEPIEVDTDNDGTFDLVLPGTSNFHVITDPNAPDPDLPPIVCHCDPASWDPENEECHCGHIHCNFPIGVDPETLGIDVCSLELP